MSLNNKLPIGAIPPPINPTITITLHPGGKLLTSPNFNNPLMVIAMLQDARDSWIRKIARDEYEKEMLASSSGLVTADGKPVFIPSKPTDN